MLGTIIGFVVSLTIRVVDLVVSFEKRHKEPQTTIIRPRASVVVVRRGSKVLCVSRKFNSTDMGLPGGSVEAGEAPDVAAIREFLEEIGHLLSDVQLHGTFEYDGRTVYVYLASDEGLPDIWPARGPEGTKISWLRAADLSQGSFAEFNVKHIVPLLAKEMATA